MAATRPSDQSISQGPVEELLGYAERILEIERQLRRARLMRRFARVSMTLAPTIILAVYSGIIITWRRFDFAAITYPSVVVVVGLGAYLWVYFFQAIVHPERMDVPDLELKLELEQERKRLRASSLDLGLLTRQIIYRDGIPQEIERYRGESKYYRRIHNIMQAVIIVGSLAGSTLTSLIQSVPSLRWFAVGTTFAVGVAAGFTGYFKFRERSFYLQQTSDSIDQELSAVSLGIGRYKNKSETEALVEFTEQTELLKVEQRKRQQQLEQPSAGREGVQ